MRTLLHVCSVMIALGVLPVPPPKTLARAATVSGENIAGDGLHWATPQAAQAESRADRAWLLPPPGLRVRRSPASPGREHPNVAALMAASGPWRGADVAAAEGDAAATTTAAPAASSAAPEETTTEESFDGDGDGGDGDFGSDFLNSLLEVIGTLLSFFTDPPGAIQKMVEQAKQLTGGARSLMARGPEGARQARLMLEEARRILETAKGIVEASNKVANAARGVATTISRPWTAARRG